MQNVLILEQMQDIEKDIDLIVQDYLNFRFPEKVDDFGKVHQ